MLVLSRKSGESINIGSQITVTVVEVKGHRVKLGLDAPRQVQIARGELCSNDQTTAPARQIVELDLSSLSLDHGEVEQPLHEMASV